MGQHVAGTADGQESADGPPFMAVADDVEDQSEGGIEDLATALRPPRTNVVEHVLEFHGSIALRPHVRSAAPRHCFQARPNRPHVRLPSAGRRAALLHQLLFERREQLDVPFVIALESLVVVRLRHLLTRPVAVV